MLRTKRILALVLTLMLILPVGVNSEALDQDILPSDDCAGELCEEEYISEVAEDVELPEALTGDIDVLIEEETTDDEDPGVLFEYKDEDLDDLKISLKIYGAFCYDSESGYYVTAGDVYRIQADTTSSTNVVQDLEFFSSNEDIVTVSGNGVMTVNDDYTGRSTDAYIYAKAFGQDGREVTGSLHLTVCPKMESFTVEYDGRKIENGDTIVLNKEREENSLLITRTPDSALLNFDIDLEYPDYTDKSEKFLSYDTGDWAGDLKVYLDQIDKNINGIVKMTIANAGSSTDPIPPLTFFVVTDDGSYDPVITTKAEVYQVAPGKKITLDASVSPAYASGAPLQYIQDSAGKKFATVDNNGVVKGLKAGTTTITIKDPNSDAEKVVTVIVAKAISSVKLAPEDGMDLYLNTEFEDGVRLIPTAKTFNSAVSESAKFIWSSSDPKIAIVDKDGYVTASVDENGKRARGKVTITCKANDGSGKSGKATVIVGKGITRFDIYHANGVYVVTKGKKLALKTWYKPDDAIKPVLTWTTSDAKIAKVDSKGVVTGVSKGTATITATDSVTGVSGTFDVTVVNKAATALTLNSKSIVEYIEYDDDYNMIEKIIDVTANVKATDEASYRLIPVSISNPEVAGLYSIMNWNESTQTIRIRLTGKSGTATFKFITADGAKTATLKVTAKKHAFDMYNVTRTHVNVLKGKKTALKVGLTPEDATDKIVWVSKHPTIATVSSTGVVTGKKVGNAQVYAKLIIDGELIDMEEFIVTVGGTATKSVTVVPADYSENEVYGVRPGGTFMLKAIPNPATASEDFLWTSSDPSVALIEDWNAVGPTTVVQAGDEPGVATITATATDGSGKKASYKLFIQEPVTSLKINGGNGVDEATGKATLTLPQGKKKQLTAEASPEEASFADNVIWTSKNKAYVTVSKTGVVKAVKASKKPIEVVCTSYDGQVRDSILVYPTAASTAAAYVFIDGLQNGIQYNVPYDLEARATLKDKKKLSGIQAFNWKCYEWLPDEGKLLDITDFVFYYDTTNTNKNTMRVDPHNLWGDGEIIVIATVQDGTDKYQAINITMIPTVESVEIIGPHSVSVGQTICLDAIILPVESETVNVYWKIDGDPNVATIDEATGVVTGKSEGIVRVIACTDDLTYPSMVSEPYVVRVGKPASKMEIYVGEQYVTDTAANIKVYSKTMDPIQLKAYVYEMTDDGVKQNINSAVEWSIKAPYVSKATITEDGMVYFEKDSEGQAIVTAKARGIDPVTIVFDFTTEEPDTTTEEPDATTEELD